MQTRRTFLAAIAATAATALAGRTLLAADEKPKKEGEWVKLGQIEAGRKEDRDVIEVKGPDRYTALSFRVERGDVEIEDIKVTFADDEKHPFSPDTRLRFREGERSGKIDLPGKARAITRIRFLYRSTGRAGDRAVVEVLGKLGNDQK
ncbi:MAG TPA: hypothetical protein VF796_19120 [Humisphaera sp.]